MFKEIGEDPGELLLELVRGRGSVDGYMGVRFQDKSLVEESMKTVLLLARVTMAKVLPVTQDTVMVELAMMPMVTRILGKQKIEIETLAAKPRR